MEDVVKKLLARLELAKAETQKNMESGKINASYRTTKSLEVVQRGSSLLFLKKEGNNAPMSTTEIGRAAGAVPRGFTEIILQWMKDRGMQGTLMPYKTDRPHKYSAQERSNRLAAGAIAYGKIKRKGTDRHITPKETIYTPIVEQTVKDIRDILITAITETIKDKK